MERASHDATRRITPLSQFRSDLLKIRGEIYSELSALRKAVRPARLFGETPVEELMELIGNLIAECGLHEVRLAAIQNEAMPESDGRAPIDECVARLKSTIPAVGARRTRLSA